MRIDRVEASRHKKDRVLVFLEDGACLKITQQELLDFGLRSGDELDEASLRKLKYPGRRCGSHRKAGHVPPGPGAQAPGQGGQ